MEKVEKSNLDLKPEEVLIGDQFILNAKKKLGSGAFGEIYYGSDIARKTEVAIKLERLDAQFPQLLREAKIYVALQGGNGIPTIFSCLDQGGQRILVIDLIGPSINDLFDYCSRKFELKTVLTLGNQMLEILEFIHSKNFVHRDIKPDNFLWGIGDKKKKLFIIDFGLAKSYKDLKTDFHVEYQEGKRLIGTATFSSINAHKGILQTRRDDLESLGYVLVYLSRGNLPWDGIPVTKTSDEMLENVMKIKIETTLDNLCKGIPEEFKIFIQYSRDLRFDENPDYVYLKKLIRTIADRNNVVFDDNYDWITKRDKLNLK